MDAITDSTAAEPDQPTRPGVLQQLWRQRNVVAVTFCATFVLVVAVLFVLPTAYVASGSVIIADREPLMSASSPVWAQKLGDPADMESNILLIRSPRLLRALLAEPGMSEAVEADCDAVSRQLVNRFHPLDCSRLRDDLEKQLLWVQDRFGVGAVGRSRVISIGYRSPVPDVAPIMVNGLIHAFLDDERSKLLRSRDEAIDWVRQRLAQVGAAMQRDDTAIEEFRNRNGLVRGVSGLLAAERLTQAAQQLSEAKSAEADAVLRMTEAAGGASSRQALESRPISDLKMQLSQARAAVAGAAQRLGPRNPELIAARRLEQALAGQLATETGRIGDAARRNLEAARARVAAAQQELAQRTEAANRAAEAETQIATMVRELETKRGTFADLSQRLSQLETERRILEPSTQLVSLAETPTRPAFPQRTPFLVGGLALATVLATAAGLLTYKPEQPGPLALGRSYTRVPILAQIPELRLRRTGKKELASRRSPFPLATAISLLDSHPPLLESVRILHARLTLAGFGNTLRTLMVASEVPGEGKSFVTLALARLARASGRRVLVIETTMRQPFLEEALSGPPSPGLGGYLMGGPADLVHLSALPGVDFLLAGEQLSSSTELLSGRRFSELLAWASSYDLVLIDTASVDLLMDAALIAPHVEGVLFCLRAGRMPTAGALNSLPELQRANGNVIGLTLTFVPDDRVATPRVAAPPARRLAQTVSARPV